MSVCKEVRNFEVHFAAKDSGIFKLPGRPDNHFKMGYDINLELAPELEQDAS